MKSSPFGTEKGVTLWECVQRDVPLGFPHPDLISCQIMLFFDFCCKTKHAKSIPDIVLESSRIDKERTCDNGNWVCFTSHSRHVQMINHDLFNSSPFLPEASRLKGYQLQRGNSFR